MCLTARAHAAAAASMNVHKYCARVVSLKHSRPTSRLPRAASVLGLNSKNPPEIKIREIDGSYHAYNNLTSFVHAMTGSGSYENMQKFVWKIREMTSGELYVIFGGF